MSELAKNTTVPKSRIIFLAIVMSSAFVVYGIQLFQMQVLDGYIYLNRARAVARRSVPIFAQRGRIYDRSFNDPIATNENYFAITVTPAQLPDNRTEVIRNLATLINRDPAEINDRLTAARSGSFVEIEVASGIDLRTISRVAERSASMPGVGWYSKPQRVYPYGSDLAHVLGFVGDITPEELQVLFNEGYTATSVLGKNGIEQQYEHYLRGSDGRRFRTVDVRGRKVGEEGEIIPPEIGNDIVLTIDKNVQQLAVKALGPRTGSVVVLQPASGAILAMVSYPSYDPNTFWGAGGHARFRRLTLDPRAPFLNRPIQSLAAPASTFKILMTAAIVEERAFPVTEAITCTGTFAFGNRIFNDWLEYGHGRVDLKRALAQSCNIYYWTVGSAHLGHENIIDYGAQFGLGTRSGIDIPGEVAGLLPTPAWKERATQTPWVGGDTVNMSIGEGFLQVTPLQMANLVAMVVNDGVLFQPYLLLEVRDPTTGRIIEAKQPRVAHHNDISLATYRYVREAMRGVLTDGTANVVITTNAVASAGKTGTGQTSQYGSLNSWFVAYAPYGESVDPAEQIVVAVMVDAANEWEWWAPKAANIILHGYFRGLNYEDAVADLRRGPRRLWYM